MEQVQGTILDMDAMLDGTLDEVADVPDYVTPPAGTYVLAVEDVAIDKRKDKAGVEKPIINVTFKVVATIETKEPPVSDGSLFSERFQYTEDGLAYFKRAAKSILNVADVSGASLRDIFATLKDVQQVNAVISHTESTVGVGAEAKNYTNLRIRYVHAPATA